MRLQSFHCPCCAGAIDVKPGAGRVVCSYCGRALLVERDAVSDAAPRVQTRHEEPTADDPEYPEPPATLSTREAARFEMSVIEQKVPEAAPDRFESLELGEDRFALVYLRRIGADGKPEHGDLDTPLQALRQSLEQDGDPGLAANVALEEVCRKPFTGKLECSVLLFDPKPMSMTAYNAGCRDALWWVSNEHGQCTHTGGYHDALERKMLREARDHFSNDRPVSLASGDLFVLVSAGFAGRGGKGMWPSGIGILTDTLNAHLGEEPLRVVTLAKNAFWEKRSKHRDGAGPPCGAIKVAAVRAIPPELATKIPGTAKMETVKSRKFEITYLKGLRDRSRMIQLHTDRQVLVWMTPLSGELPEATFEAGVHAILEVLDGQTGDNDNPRCAGRDAYAAMAVSPAAVHMAIIQCLDQWGRVKYFRSGWKQPVALGPRGLQSDGMQQFDEGGEATVNPGSRLFFPGPLEYEGQHGLAESFAHVWHGGKASRLYEAMRDHWKTKKTDKALEKLVLAAASDTKVNDATGIALVTGMGSP